MKSKPFFLFFFYNAYSGCLVGGLFWLGPVNNYSEHPTVAITQQQSKIMHSDQLSQNYFLTQIGYGSW